jgi:hypothetical protein
MLNKIIPPTQEGHSFSDLSPSTAPQCKNLSKNRDPFLSLLYKLQKTTRDRQVLLMAASLLCVSVKVPHMTDQREQVKLFHRNKRIDYPPKKLK